MQYKFLGMQLVYNVNYEVAAILFLIVMLIFMWMQYADSTESAKSFRRLLIVLIFTNMMDILTAIDISYADKLPYWFNMFSNMCYFMAGSVLLFMYVNYIRSFCRKNTGKVNIIVSNIVFGLFSLLQIVNLFTGLVFDFKDNVYVHGPVYYSGVTYSVFMILNALYIGLRNFKFINRRQRISIIAFSSFEILGSLIQALLLPNVLVGMFSGSLAFVVIMFALETPDYKKLEIAMEQLRESSELLAHAKAEAEEAKIEAEEANRAKSSFLASMSHEIRTPINGVLGMNSIILKESTDPKIREYARNVDNAGNGLLSLINDILDFSKIESGRMEIVPVEYELSNVLSACYNMVFLRAQDKNIDLLFENNKTIPNRLYGDEVRIRQIIVNLLTNAIKYTEEGLVMLTADWETVDMDTMNLIVSVKDTGIGIKKENLDLLFSAFQRVDEKRNRNIEGTGLGLKITKQFLDIMGGTIEVDSVFGKGSEFTVKIPQKIVNGYDELGNFSSYVHISTNEEDNQTTRFRCPGCTILAVDDVEMNLKVIKGLLRDTQLTIDTAVSGAECLDRIMEKKYDIILMDHMMPNMDGVETFAEMKKRTQFFDGKTPVIMLTANAIQGVREEYLSYGFTDYLSKPVREDDLNSMLLKYLPKEKVTLVYDKPSPPVKEEVKKKPVNPEEAFSNQKETEVQDTVQSDFEKRFGFLDVKTGLTYCMESEEFYESIIREYRNTSKYEDIQEAYDNADVELYATLVHGVKSSSMTIGAVEVSELAKALEFASKSGDIDYLKEHHYEFMRKYGTLLDNLDEVYGAYGN